MQKQTLAATFLGMAMTLSACGGGGGGGGKLPPADGQSVFVPAK